MKASDIPDDVFLQAVRVAGDTWAERWGHPGHGPPANWGDVTGVLRVILGAVPERVVLVKARRLIRRGLLDGVLLRMPRQLGDRRRPHVRIRRLDATPPLTWVVVK